MPTLGLLTFVYCQVIFFFFNSCKAETLFSLKVKNRATFK